MRAVNVNCSSEHPGHEEETVLITIRSEDDNAVTTITIKWIVILMIKKFSVCAQPKDNYPCPLTRAICTTPATCLCVIICYIPVFLNGRAAARYRALASIIPGRERPEEITICYNI